MASCVIDTSAIMAVLLGEPDRAILVRETEGMELVAPASVHWEIGNALSAGLKRRRFGLAEARRALDAYDMIPIRCVDVSLAEPLDLSAQHGVYAYDAYLLACARQQRSPLLTLDVALARVAEAIGVDLLLPLP
jgi:predicted nucleic acid-binding protein